MVPVIEYRFVPLGETSWIVPTLNEHDYGHRFSYVHSCGHCGKIWGPSFPQFAPKLEALISREAHEFKIPAERTEEEWPSEVGYRESGSPACKSRCRG